MFQYEKINCILNVFSKKLKMCNNRAKSDTEMSKQYMFERHETRCKVISKDTNGLSKNGVW